MLETEITLQREGVALAGTLTQPGGESAVVVICLHGSGPLDRNENMPGQRLDTFNTLANAFAAEGIATYRYDKRGCGASTGTYATASHDELVADARAVISEMRARGFERIVLLGHSEGTLIAAQLASEVQGLVLLAPFIAPLRALLMSQADEMQRVLDTTKGFIAWLNRRIVAALGGTRVLQEQLIAKIEASTTPTLRHYGRKVEAANLRQMLSLDPAAIYAQVRVPVLIVSGGKDVQCPPGDGSRIADIVPGPSELHLIDDLTHLLRRSDTAAGFRGYAAQFSQPMDPSLAALAVAWLRASFAPHFGHDGGEIAKQR